MKTVKWMTGFLAYMFFTMSALAAIPSASDTQSIQVGRIYHIDGELLRYVSDTNDWVAVVKDAPFGVEDTLFSGNKGMAELIAPNGSWIRMGNNTQVQFIALDSELTEIDVASGTGRFYNKGSNTVIKVTSPFGYVLADPGTTFDFYVGENSAEVVAIKGTVNFVHSAGNAKYDVTAGSPSILADQDQVSSGDGTTDPIWNRWNENRDNIWSAKSNPKGRSTEYLPPNLRYEADCLDENGRWELLPYEGRECWFWRPTTIAVGWSPFTIGIWTDWCGDQTWVPGEPFGYVTHHYGNWIIIGDLWYWAPPVVSVRVGLPLLDIGFFWYPGRVSWIHRGVYVGWVPLAPHETYYSHRNWGGPHHGVVVNEAIDRPNINVRNYIYVNHAVIVNRNNFHGVDNYRDVRIGNIHPTIIDKYQAAPVVNNRVINNYESDRQRYNYGKVTAQEKPHSTVINRIRQNETTIRQSRKENAESLQQQVKTAKEGKINRDARIEAPKAANYLVPAEEVNRPKSEIKLRQRVIKTGEETSPAANAGGAGKSGNQNNQIGQPVTLPKSATSSKSNEMQKPAVQPDRVVMPARPVQQDKSVTQPDSATSSKSNEMQKPAVQPDRIIMPAKSGQQEKSAVQTEQITPVNPSQVEKPITQPKVITPAKPNEPEKPAVKSDSITVPAKPNTPTEQGGVLVPKTSIQKSTDKSKNVESSGSTTQKGKVLQKVTRKKSDESSAPAEKPEQQTK